MNYTYNGKTVKEEAWKWSVEYADGSVLSQFDKDGTFHMFKEIEAHRASKWVISNGDKNISIDVSPEMKLIHFYRRRKTATMEGEELSSSTIYCFGYETPEEKIIHMIYPNDVVVTARDADAVIGAKVI